MSLETTDKPVSLAGALRSGVPQVDQLRHFEQGLISLTQFPCR